jgi:hypothetical protein
MCAALSQPARPASAAIDYYSPMVDMLGICLFLEDYLQE